MFRKALLVASTYTGPVILSRKPVKGDCSSSIGAFVVVNQEGWIVTAFHIMQKWQELMDGEKLAQDNKTQYDTIANDPSLNARERKRKFSKLTKLRPDATERASVWWGGDGITVKEVQGIKAIDLAVGRMEPFNPSSVSTYPTFKDPAKDFRPGTTLCKLGFPFHSIKPTWNDDTQVFELPPGSLPLPRFPIGFSPKVPGSKSGQREHQFINVGRGIHAETILGYFQELGINFNLSSY